MEATNQKSLDQKILETEKTIKTGSSVRAIRDGADKKRGVVTVVTSCGCYIHNPKIHPAQQDFDPPGCAEWFALRNYKNGKLSGGVVLA